MRASLAIMAGLAFLVGACSSSTGSSATAGTTSGGRSTTGGQTLLAAGAHCASNQACASGVCGVGGDGNCCAQACSTADATCGAIGCDGTGACAYPNNAITCPSSCTGDMLSQNICNGDGGCVSMSSTPCEGHFACDESLGACNAVCSSSADCATGFVCNGLACVPPIKVGACTEDDDCTTGQCGIHGLGHCCAAACSSATPPCGATDCDADGGACIFPISATACGTVTLSCTGSTQTNPTHCDGLGNCDTPGPTDCAPYGCEGTVCGRTCGQDGGCAPGDFCQMSDSTCCAGLSAGGTITVDAKLGNDPAACCGIGTNLPCQTITHAMTLIDAAQARDVTILATVNAGEGADWEPLGETFPLVLGWGAELKAPGVYFADKGSSGGVFNIGRISGYDHIGYASIVGAPGNPVWIGKSYEGLQSNDATIIQVEGTNALYIANANLESSEEYGSTAIAVAADATLVLGGDHAAAVTGTVTIGDSLASYQNLGSKGIVCGTAKNMGCTISDVPLNGVSSVVIQGQEEVDIDAEDYAVISLTSAPVIGLSPTMAGLGTCNAKADSQAVLLNGKASVTLDNATVQCISGRAFQLQSTANGVPSLTLNGTTIQNTDLGIYATAGTAAISNSTIQYNGIGVEQATDGKNIGTIDLSGSSSDGGTNIVVCSSSSEGGGGVSVLNTTTQALNASNVSWDTSGPDLFKCNVFNMLFTGCTCEITSCTDMPGANGMDAVYETTGTITTTGNQLSTVSCSPGG